MNSFAYDEEEAAMPYNPEESETDYSASLSPIAQVKQNHESELMAIDGVEGVGVGRNQIGEAVILVYLRDDEAGKRVPHSIDGFQVKTEITGIVDAY